MLVAEWVIVAKGLSIDRDTNTLTAFGILSGIRVENFPLLMQQLSVGVLLRREESDPDSFDIKLLINHNKAKLFEGGVPVKFGGKASNQIAINLHGLVIPGPGAVTFSIMHKKKRLGSFELRVDGPSAELGRVFDHDAAASMGSDSKDKGGKAKRRRRQRR